MGVQAVKLFIGVIISMDADFCRYIRCRIREVMDKPEQAGYLTRERKQEILNEEICKNCNGYKYYRYLKDKNKVA